VVQLFFIYYSPAVYAVDRLEQTGQTKQLAPDFRAWLEKILNDEIPYVQRVSSVKASLPKH
jgi:hypothetical protein